MANNETLAIKVSDRLVSAILKAKSPVETKSTYVRNILAEKLTELGLYKEEESSSSRLQKVHGKILPTADLSPVVSSAEAPFPGHDFHRNIDLNTDFIQIMTTFTLVVQQTIPQIYDAITKGRATLQCLIWDPKCSLVPIRDEGLGKGRGYVKAEIQNTIRGFSDLLASLPEDKRDRCQLRLFQQIPPCRAYMVDSVAYIGFLPLAGRAIDDIHLLAEGETNPLIEFAKLQFGYVWETAPLEVTFEGIKPR